MHDRGERVRHERRIKDRMRRIWWVGKPGEATPTPRWIGHMASTHGKPCSCASCGNLRRYIGPTIQERRAEPVPEGPELHDVPDDPAYMDWEYVDGALGIFKSQDTRPLRVPLALIARSR